MRLNMIRAKLHRAYVTAADLHYEGSIGIDTDFLREAGIFPYEQVAVVDIDNGARLETYVIPAEAGSGAVQLNGAAARLVSVGDRVIIMAYAQVDFPPPADWAPRVVIFDDTPDRTNRVKQAFGPLHGA